MIQYLDPVPFTVDNDSHLGFSETQGLLSSDGRYLIIEFRIADTVIGVMKTPSSELKVALSDIQSIRFEKKYLGLTAAITIQARSQQVLEILPEAKMGRAVLAIKRRDRQAAQEFCLAIQELVMRTRNQLMQDEITRLEQGDGDSM